LQIDARTWYAGTPETDRFRGNEPGAILHVEIDAAGATPRVERHDIGRFTWRRQETALLVPSDVDALAQALAGAGANDVVQLTITGSANLQTRQRLMDVIAQAHARVMSLRCDTGRLRLQPDESDLASLGATGYVLDVAHRLQSLQDDVVQGDVAREALRLLLEFEGELSGQGVYRANMSARSEAAEPFTTEAMQ
jgi:hypothetical protein